MADDRRAEPERPRFEPEIIPPDRVHAPPEDGGRVWYYVREDGTGRIHVAQPGPFSIILALLIGGLLIAAFLFVLLGTVLIVIPVIAAVVAATFLSGSIRHYWRKLRGS